MTRRAFYTDPLAAAWMCKHFGMQFGIKHEGRVIWDCESQGMSNEWHPIRDWEHIAADAADGDAQAAYYVHPDSLSLLEPQAGDLVRWRIVNPRGGYFADAGAFALYGEGHGHVERIVERDGLAFHWPLWEEV